MATAPKPGKTITLYRAFYEEFAENPIPSRSTIGRFHDEATREVTTYLATSPETAWREVRHRWRGAKEAYRIAQVKVRVSSIADLTDPTTRKRYGIDTESLISNDYGPCQRLRRRLEEEGIEAIWTYSRADQPAGRQLVVLLAQLKGSSSVEVIRTEPVDM